MFKVGDKVKIKQGEDKKLHESWLGKEGYLVKVSPSNDRFLFSVDSNPEYEEDCVMLYLDEIEKIEE